MVWYGMAWRGVALCGVLMLLELPSSIYVHTHVSLTGQTMDPVFNAWLT